MKEKHYQVCKKKSNKEVININYNKLEGFGFIPRNNVKYNGIIVNKLIVVKPNMIENVLKRKIKRKLDIYLKLIINFIDSENDPNGDSLREALNDLSRYKNIIQYKYRKYLDEKYFKVLAKKIAVLEYELNAKIIDIEYQSELEKITSKSR